MSEPEKSTICKPLYDRATQEAIVMKALQATIPIESYAVGIDDVRKVIETLIEQGAAVGEFQGMLDANGAPTQWAYSQATLALSQQRTRAEKAEADAKAWKRTAEDYVDAWKRNLGQFIDPKRHLIDALCGGTRRLREVADRREPVKRAGIYFASKTKHAQIWKNQRALGVPVVSTWIDEAGAGESKCLQDLWMRCVDEARNARVLLVYREPDDVLKGAFIEIGAALANGVPVVAVGFIDSGMSWVNHPLVTEYADLPVAIGAAIKIARS